MIGLWDRKLHQNFVVLARILSVVVIRVIDRAKLQKIGSGNNVISAGKRTVENLFRCGKSAQGNDECITLTMLRRFNAAPSQ